MNILLVQVSCIYFFIFFLLKTKNSFKIVILCGDILRLLDPGHLMIYRANWTWRWDCSIKVLAVIVVLVLLIDLVLIPQYNWNTETWDRHWLGVQHLKHIYSTCCLHLTINLRYLQSMELGTVTSILSPPILRNLSNCSYYTYNTFYIW